MNVVFYTRNFGTKQALNLNVTVERYSHAMIGGPDTATLTIKDNPERWDLTNLLRCPVEIWEFGKPVWWGFVNQVVAPNGVNREGVGLDNMYNSVRTQYDKGTTTAATLAQSISEFGTKELLNIKSAATQADALFEQATFFANQSEAIKEIDLSGGSGDIQITCKGWWHTLGWKYYTNTVDTRIDTITQLQAIITSCGQFINGVKLETLTSGNTCTQKRDGKSTGLNYINELLNAGTSNARPILAYVDSDRYIHIYERVAKTTEYLMRNDGKLETLAGRKISDEYCQTAKWVQIKSVPSNLTGGLTDMDPFFLERAECVGKDVKDHNPDITHREFETHYTAAHSFNAVRLDQYMTDLHNSGSGVSVNHGGSVFGTPTPSTPPTAQAPAITKCLMVEPTTLGLMYTENLGTASTWTDINTTLGATKGKIIKRVFIVPAGGLYVAAVISNDDNFLAKAADGPGGDFVEIFNQAVADDYFGAGSVSSLRIEGVCYNPLLPDEVIFLGGNSNGYRMFRVKNGTDIEAITPLTSLVAANNTTFGGDLFFAVDGSLASYTFGVDYSGLVATPTFFTLDNGDHVRAGILATIMTTITGAGLRISLDNGQTYLDYTSLGIDRGADTPRLVYKMAVDNTGAQILTRNQAGDTSRFSLDGGNTFADVSGIAGAGFVYAFAGGDALDTRWIAIGNSKVYYSDKATASWVEVTGDIITTLVTFTGATVVLPIGDADFPIIPIDPVDQAGAAVDLGNYTSTTAAAAVVEDAITNGVTDKAPSENAVFDALALKQPLDSDLTAIAGLTPTDDDIIQRKAGAWVNRTLAQLITDLTTGLSALFVVVTRTVNGHALSADVTVTKGDVSLGSVDNVQQMPLSYLDTDGTLAANSDAKVASQKAVKTYVGTSAGIADAASDGVYYGRRNAAWTNLKTYFDTLYLALTGGTVTGDIVIDGRELEAKAIIHNDSGISFREQNIDGSFVWIKGDFGSGAISGYLRSQFQGSVSTTELITNGTFETGDFTGWTQTGSPVITSTNPFKGTYAAKCTAANTVKETITVVNGDYYLLEFAVKMDSDSDFHGIVAITNGDQANYDAGNQHGGNWIRGAALIRTSSTSLVLEFKAAGGTNFVYFDNITLKHCSSFSLEGMDSSGRWNVISTSASPLLVSGTDVLAKLVTNGDTHDHVGGDGAKLLFLFPFATYVDLNPITATGKYPFGGSVEAGMVFSNLSQTIYLAGANHSSSVYYTYNIWFRKQGSADLKVATFDTKTAVTGTNVFVVTSFTNATITGTGYLFVELLKTSTPSDIYVLCPALKATLS